MKFGFKQVIKSNIVGFSLKFCLVKLTTKLCKRFWQQYRAIIKIK